jgi:hypothetical protein
MGTTRQIYVPGVCNIGGAERAQRRRVGWGGLAITVLLWAAFIVFRVSAGWRLFLILPAGTAATGFLQSALHFCAGFGMRGVFNFGTAVGITDTVEQAEFRRKDRAKALQIFGWSVLIGIAVGVIGFFAVW